MQSFPRRGRRTLVHSLSRRLLISVALPLALFSAVTMLVLDRGFRTLSERSLQELLDAEMVALIAAADPQPGGGYAPAAQALEPRLETPQSGVYAQIRSSAHAWRSPSTAGITGDFGAPLPHGERSLTYADFDHDRVAIESRAIQFEEGAAESGTYTFSVAVSLAPYEQQLWQFRRQLLGWFSGLLLALLVTLAALLRWVLAPLRRMEREIHAVEEGRSDTLGAGYPRELAGVAGNLNALLLGERKRVGRYRDTLGNLAHSLKTPLAVMRASLPADASAATLGGEIDRMKGIIEHQLKRAAATGGALLGRRPGGGGAGGRRTARRAPEGLRRQGPGPGAGRRSGQRLHRRPRRSAGDAGEPARQRLQVVPQPGAPVGRGRSAGRGAAAPGAHHRR